MAELDFHVESAAPVLHAAAPAVALTLRVRAADARPVDALLLRCQVRVEPLARRYDAGEEARLAELFGDPGAWSRTVASFVWTQLSLTVPGFVGTTHTEVTLPCGYDFGLAAHRYTHALAGGDLPLTLLFSGTMFREDDDGLLRATPIAWSSEAHHRLPLAVVVAALEHHYPGRAVLSLERPVFERLYAYRRAHGLATWEQALERLLPGADAAEVTP
jgi:hypothetical protein